MRFLSSQLLPNPFQRTCSHVRESKRCVYSSPVPKHNGQSGIANRLYNVTTCATSLKDDKIQRQMTLQSRRVTLWQTLQSQHPTTGRIGLAATSSSPMRMATSSPFRGRHTCVDAGSLRKSRSATGHTI